MMGQLTRNEVFTLAVQKYSDAVYRAAMHNSRCAADAEDVVQDVYELSLIHISPHFTQNWSTPVSWQLGRFSSLASFWLRFMVS